MPRAPRKSWHGRGGTRGRISGAASGRSTTVRASCRRCLTSPPLGVLAAVDDGLQAKRLVTLASWGASKGLGDGSGFNIGVRPSGRYQKIGHTAGTIAGTNVESSGSD